MCACVCVEWLTGLFHQCVCEQDVTFISKSKLINLCLDTAVKRHVPVGEWLPKNVHGLLQHVRIPRTEEDIQSFFIGDPRGKLCCLGAVS